MHEHVLSGCRTEPLGSYLKALGVLRLVGEQADPAARGWWTGDSFVLRTGLDRAALEGFFLDEYRPTPAISPWNGDSGFKEEKKAKYAAALKLIESSTSSRLADFREVISIGRSIYEEAQGAGCDKSATVLACRNRLPDSALPWIDSAVVLAAGKEVFPPLLGTGGNDGRVDFSNSFMQRLGDVFCLRNRRGAPDGATSRCWLESALWGTPTPLVIDPVGQFHPGGAGGANSSPIGAAESLVNPWDWVLLIEGSLLFASASARRLDLNSGGRASVPFTVAATPVAYGSSADGESSRGEIWAPLWNRPADVREVRRVIGEGRADWRRSQSRSATDLARAATSLGVDRGIASFVRHALLERNGRSTAAVPVGRVEVRDDPAVAVTAQLDTWIATIRRGKNPPASVSSALHRVDESLFTLATRIGPEPLQQLLIAVADLDSAVSRATGFRTEAKVAPVQGLVAASWLDHLDDGTPEFRVAAALASQHDPDERGLRDLLTPIRRMKRRITWSESPAAVTGLGHGGLGRLLAMSLVRRSVEVVRSARETGPSEARVPGVQTAYQYRIAAPLADVAMFAEGRLDVRRIEGLFRALLLLDWSGRIDVARWHAGGGGVPARLDPALCLLVPFFHGRPLRGSGGEEISLIPEASWPSQLVHGHNDEVIRAALRRLTIARLIPALGARDVGVLAATAPAGADLAAALLVPVSTPVASRLLARAVPEPIDPATSRS